MVQHDVTIAIEEQAAVTRVVQTFHNPTDRPLEATYVFPVPKGAGVRKFAMWVDGKEVPGELVEAGKARAIYTEIVRRTQDPGLLEYMDGNLLKLRVFPVPARGDQKVALSFTAIAQNYAGLTEYMYPLRKAGRDSIAPDKLTIEATLTSQYPIQSIYSPSHAITVTRADDRHARVRLESGQGSADKDFQLYYTSAARDVGLTALFHRPARTDDGSFMMLISPRTELSRRQHVARDMVFVLDTSGSMQGTRIKQAQSALKYCLRNLGAEDRFGLIQFATTVAKYSETLLPADSRHIHQAQKWVEGLEAVGCTNIDEALAAALAMRSADNGRNFTVVFFTDGQPTIGEQNPGQIVKNALAKNSAGTRIFTFGVGDDVNAVLLDQLADSTRSVSTYVRETEDIEAKVSGLYSKISKPVLTDLKLTVAAGVRLTDVYPPHLPDLFHGSQLVVLGRYKGKGPATVTLTGMVGNEKREFVYEVPFPGKTKKDKSFVEDLWARRKVGYLLDQVRSHGENKEVVEEVIRLAKHHGIATPYTSYLVAPDSTVGHASAMHQTLRDENEYRFWTELEPDNPAPPRGFVDTDGTAVPTNGLSGGAGGGAAGAGGSGKTEFGFEAGITSPSFASLPTAGKQGVDLSVQVNGLRNQSQVSPTTIREAAGRRCRQVNGGWIDTGFDGKTPTVKVKALSDAYFRLLERQPQLREVFQLGNSLVWITPSGTALVIAPAEGSERLGDAEIDGLFKKK